jgi:septum formation protein
MSRPSGAKAVFRNLEPLILASASPRRRELLMEMGLKFDVIPSDTDEAIVPEESPETQVKRWASEKAQVAAENHPDQWVIAADTTVVLDEMIFGKPQDCKEAEHMLRQLSDRTHEVMSGICLVNRGRNVFQVRSVITQVRFKKLSDLEIAAYVETDEPFDKAGGYGIQGMGAFLVQSISGSYTNVVGLPLCETLELLMENRVIAPGGNPSPPRL